MEQGHRPVAVVLGVNGFGGLGAVRSLGRAGVGVVGLDTDRSGLGFATRYARSERCPDPVRQPAELVRFLRHVGGRLAGPAVLFATEDEYALVVSRYRDDLREHFRFNLPPAETMESCLDKRKQYGLAARLGVPLATTDYPETMEDVRRVGTQLAYPAYVKPYYSHLWQARFPGLGKGIKVYSEDELLAAFEQVFRGGLQAMVQSIIEGPATNILIHRSYTGLDGDVLAEFTSRKIRQYPPEFGFGTMEESRPDAEVAQLGRRFLRGIGYRGFAGIEFKRDDRDGELKLIELNPRFCMQIGHSTACGVDFPLVQYLDLVGEDPAPQMTFASGVRWAHGATDFKAFWSCRRAGQLPLREWARSWLGVRVCPIFAADDPGPFLRSNLQRGARALRLARSAAARSRSRGRRHPAR